MTEISAVRYLNSSRNTENKNINKQLLITTPNADTLRCFWKKRPMIPNSKPTNGEITTTLDNREAGSLWSLNGPPIISPNAARVIIASTLEITASL